MPPWRSSQFIQRSVIAAALPDTCVVRIGISTATVSTLQNNNVRTNARNRVTNDSLRASRSACTTEAAREPLCLVVTVFIF